ncbi:DUF11 domain-containing protein [Deinococcus sonorensis]|uniref:DUF11 domain-containing protein n=2 Tax=Deinococcus sonorensis TaxID=309891 RepID=A0AAU7UCK9_9DEIO
MTAVLALIVGLGLPRAAAVGTPAGTVITNVATGTFDPVAPGDVTEAQSNTVSSVVQAICAVSVSPDGTVAAAGQQAVLLPGEQTTFPYTVVNAGNAPATLPLIGAVEATSAFAPTTAVYQDLNGNGRLDGGEPQISSVTLPADGSAQVLLVVRTTDAARGDAFVNLIGACSGGAQDSNNVSRVTVGPPPELTVQKTFSPALVRPGSETTVTVKASNNGQGDSRELLLSDPLAAQLSQGLSFVPGSAAVSGAAGATLEYTADGTTWGAAEPTPVQGVRVRVASLPAGAQLNLSFRMLAGASAENHMIPNVATATTGGKDVASTATADVRYQPAVAIGPLGVPEAPEDSPSDTQTRSFGVVGQLICFDHTLKNTGDVQDSYTLTVQDTQGHATATLLSASGAPLVQPLTLDPGASTPVRVCYAADQAGALDALVTATGARGTSNRTRDVVQALEAGLPEVHKSSSVAPGVTVASGEFITYTLTVRNPYAQPLTGVVLSDPLPAHTDEVEASGGGSVTGTSGAQTVQWALGTLQPGETRTVTVRVVVTERALDGEVLKNTGQLTSSELPAAVPSNEVVTPVWSASLSVTKVSSAAQATFGDRLVYTLRIRNHSPTTDIVDALVTDTPAVGLQYVAGTSTLDGQAFPDPDTTARVLRWTVDRIPAGGEVVITYATRVTPEATGTLVNTVQVVGIGAGGTARAISSNQAVATATLAPLKFAPLGDLIGVVFIDRNRNGIFDAGVDTPVERARVLLAGGRLTLTDRSGRYHFTNVPYGLQALRLDPGSTPYPARPMPADGGLRGTQTVEVRGLTSVDFPLEPLPSAIDVLRRTTLTVGDVRIDKVVVPDGDGYRVTLTIQSPRTLEAVTLTDPLPDGAVLKEGRNTYSGTLSAGETSLTYRFNGVGADRAATTDPDVSWRY